MFAIEVGIETFYMDDDAIVARDMMYKYCETEFGFKGDRWEEIKFEIDDDELEKLLESQGIHYKIIY
jgi:hypothetical protein